MAYSPTCRCTGTCTCGAGIQSVVVTVGQGGPRGVQGRTGAQGTAGSGTQGVQGAVGPIGPGGGAQGTTGSQGASGTGAQGVAGAQGTTGSGAQGTAGSQGATGTGTQGLAGAQGATGFGAQGTSGSQGALGTQGITGSGTQGTSGSQGIQGIQGGGVSLQEVQEAIAGAALGTTDDLTEGTSNLYFRIDRVSYDHIQDEVSDTWVIVHNLGFKPNVTVQDSAGSIYEGEITYTNSDSLTITFSAAFSGKAFLS